MKATVAAILILGQFVFFVIHGWFCVSFSTQHDHCHQRLVSFLSWVSVASTLLSSQVSFQGRTCSLVVESIVSKRTSGVSSFRKCLHAESQFIQGHSYSQRDLPAVTNWWGNKGLDILTHLRTTHLWKNISRPSHWVDQTYSWIFLLFFF